jgi:PelA/Pel-15E family pectate lyase
LLLPYAAVAQDAPAPAAVPWKQALRQKPDWYGSAEAVRIADNLLLYQHDNGGWPKNIDMAEPLDAKGRAKVEKARRDTESTIDNGATHTQLTYLARVYDATKSPKYRAAFEKGFDWLLAAQYPNGGWPQYFPVRKGYYTHITFNDDAMIGVLELLRDVAAAKAPYAWADAARRARATDAVRRGNDCIVKCQILVNGKRTVWCQQHDEKTFAPAPARKFEPAALCSTESAAITRYLMQIPSPSPEVRQAVEGAVAWFKSAQLTGQRYIRKPAPGTERGYDMVLEADPAAPPLWARMYEIGTNRPIFTGRDSIVRYRVTEIEYERRTGYAWYSDRPGALLEKDFPAWRTRVAKK